MIKRISLLLVFLSTFVMINAQKMERSFWGATLGESIQQVYDALINANLDPIVTDDALYLKNNTLYKTQYQTIGFKFTGENTFYNIFGYSKFTSKKEAENAFLEALDMLKQQYIMNKISGPAGCLKLYAYADADTDEAFSLGLYKNDNGAYFVRFNLISNFLYKRANK